MILLIFFYNVKMLPCIRVNIDVNKMREELEEQVKSK